MHLHQWWTRPCMLQSVGLISIKVTHCCSRCCWNAPLTTSLCSYPLFGLYRRSVNVEECQWVPFFLPWRNSVPHLCFICTSTSGAILPDCPSAAICHTATTRNRILLGRFNRYCHTTNIHLQHHGPTPHTQSTSLKVSRLPRLKIAAKQAYYLMEELR